MDDSRHQSQHTASALELHQRRPVVVEPVEYLRVDRIGRFNALLVIRITTLWRKFSLEKQLLVQS